VTLDLSTASDVLGPFGAAAATGPAMQANEAAARGNTTPGNWIMQMRELLRKALDSEGAELCVLIANLSRFLELI
jgi:hypothetical protein